MTHKKANLENLANAIVHQAVKDYMKAVKKRNTNLNADREIRQCLKFFRSDWFTLLSNINPDVLIKKLQSGHTGYCLKQMTDENHNIIGEDIIPITEKEAKEYYFVFKTQFESYKEIFGEDTEYA